jgi:hypothetical protein
MCTQCSPTRSDFISLGDFNQLVVHDEQCRSSLLRVCEMAAGSSSASAQLNNGGAAQYRHQRERVPFASFFRRECRYCGTLNEEDECNRGIHC